jgi:hypothetical protein
LQPHASQLAAAATNTNTTNTNTTITHNHPPPRRYFPAGELDDGGCAMLPICAGLLPSRAEEEAGAGQGDPYLLADVWAQSVGLQVGLRLVLVLVVSG